MRCASSIYQIREWARRYEMAVDEYEWLLKVGNAEHYVPVAIVYEWLSDRERPCVLIDSIFAQAARRIAKDDSYGWHLLPLDLLPTDILTDMAEAIRIDAVSAHEDYLYERAREA